MMGLVRSATGFWNDMRAKKSVTVRSRPIDPSDVVPAIGDAKFEARKHYFSVSINELHLANSREWFTLYDPMALVLVDFTYNGKKVTTPYVLGPLMLEDQLKTVPNNMSLTDTKVAGVTPYAGGTFAVTVVLAKVKRASYAKNLLNFVESVTGAFPAGVEIKPHLAVAETVLKAVETLFGMGDDVVPIAGQRWEYNPGSTPWFRPGFFALLNADEAELAATKLLVKDGRLAAEGRDIRDDDFLVYSVNLSDNRDDITELSFYELYRKALVQAGSAETGAWERAKAGLFSVYQEMLTSPDLTWSQAQSEISSMQTEMLATKSVADGFATMSGKAASAAIPEFGDPFAGAQPGNQQSAAIDQVQSLLNLEPASKSD